MQTHPDLDAKRAEWLKSLEEKADKMVERRESEITAGAPGEEALERWQAKGMSVVHLPDDEHGLCRVSIGGGDDTPIGDLAYLTFRGDPRKCKALIRRALLAISKGVSG